MAFNKPLEENKQPKTEGSFNKPVSNQGGGQFSAPKPTPNATLNRQGSKALSGATIKPGSPNKGPKIPAGIVQKPFETQKGMDKRTNKMFKKTGQPTLGIWNRSGGDETAGPDKIKFNPAFDKTKEINQKLNSVGSESEIPDVPHDEDYERSWGPEDTRRTYVDDHGKRQKIDGSGLELFSNEDGSFTLQDNAYIIDRYNDINDLLDAGFSQEEVNQLNSGEPLYFANENKERERASKLFGTDLTKNNQVQELPEEFKAEKGIPGQDYSFYEDGTFSTKHRPAASSFEEGSVAYEGLGKFYGLNLENMVYGKNGFMADKYPNGFPDFKGDVLYSPKYWDEFEEWAKQKYGVDLEQIRKDNFKEFSKKNKPYSRF